MKNIINLLVAGSLLGCTNNVEVVSSKEIKDINKPEKILHIPTSYGLFKLKKYEKGSEITPIGGLNSIKPLRDIDGDWKPDEIKQNGNWVAIEKDYVQKSEDIYNSVYSQLN